MLQLLIAVGSAPRPLSLSEAASQAGLVPSTALRQLRSLEAAQLITRDPDDQLFQPGPALIRLAGIVFAGRSLAALAQPYLEALAHDTGESAYLAVPAAPGGADLMATYVATAAGHHALRHSGWVGRAFACAGTAVGAALGGTTDDDGTAVRSDTLEPGITAIAAPVRSGVGLLAAINLVGPSFRLNGPPLSAARQAVADYADRLSAACGEVDTASANVSTESPRHPGTLRS